MTYEEKRELRIQISQLLADAGLNQATIKQMVEEEIRNKVARAVDQTIKSLNAESSSGNYFEEKIRKMFQLNFLTQRYFSDAVKEELKNRVIQVNLSGVKVDDKN